MPVILWNTNIVEEESEHVQAFRNMREKIKDPPILLDMGLGIWLQSMDHVRELHSITDEEDGEVVPYQIKVSLMQRRHIRIQAEGKDLLQIQSTNPKYNAAMFKKLNTRSFLDESMKN